MDTGETERTLVFILMFISFIIIMNSLYFGMILRKLNELLERGNDE